MTQLNEGVSLEQKRQQSDKVQNKPNEQNSQPKSDQNIQQSQVSKTTIMKQQDNKQLNNQIKQQSKQTKQPKQQFNEQKILTELKKINQTVIYDISIKKGRKQKFINHMNLIQTIQKNFQNHISLFQQQRKNNIYQKFSIIYYNLARLGQNQVALQTAILLLQLSKSNRYLIARWKMQLAAMRSSISHKASYKVSVQAMSKIILILQDLSNNLKTSKPKLSYFLQLVLKVINSNRKNDFIWIHNPQNNIKCFTDHIRQLILSSQFSNSSVLTQSSNTIVNQSQQSNYSQQPFKSQLLLKSISSIKVQPFYPGYDFQIADYMSLQKLQFDYIQKYNQLSDIKQVAKQIVIFASICCFTQATQNYYMANYNFKYLHFKAIEIALLAVDKQCTYVGFLLKILNDYYGTKMSQIRQQNSQFIQINQLKRKMPKDKKQVPMKNLSFAQQ